MTTVALQKSYDFHSGGISPATVAEIYDQWCGYRDFMQDQIKAGQSGEPMIRGKFGLGAISLDYLIRWPQFQEPVIQMLKALFATSYLDFIHERIGPEFYLSLGSATFRRQPPTSHISHLSLHQDAVVYGEDVVALNMWLPLVDCGKDAPGLSFVRQHPGRRIFEYNDLVSGDRLGGVDFEASVPRGSEIDNLVYRRGDFVLFDHHALHRTHVAPSMTRDRVAMELRVYSYVPKSRLMFPYWSNRDLSALGILG